MWSRILSKDKVQKSYKGMKHVATEQAWKKIEINNLFVTSKNETTNYPIHQFKVLHKGQRAF